MDKAKRIEVTALVTNVDHDLFIKNVHNRIQEIQDMGLVVEVQYQLTERHHSAFIIGRKEN